MGYACKEPGEGGCSLERKLGRKPVSPDVLQSLFVWQRGDGAGLELVGQTVVEEDEIGESSAHPELLVLELGVVGQRRDQVRDVGVLRAIQFLCGV